MFSLKFWTWFSYGEKRPAFLEFRSSQGFIVTAMSLAVFTVSTPLPNNGFLGLGSYRANGLAHQDIFLYGLVCPCSFI